MLESIQPYIGVLGCALAVILLVYCIILHIRLELNEEVQFLHAR